MAAMSNPPTLLNTSTMSAGSGLFRFREASMVRILRSRPASESPAPRPVNSLGPRFSSAQATAVAVVVLPMPISPVHSEPISGARLLHGQLGPGQNCLYALETAHRWPLRTICCTAAYAPVYHTGEPAVIKQPHPDIHRYHTALGNGTHVADGTVSFAQCAGHGGSHFRSTLTDSLNHHPVVCTKYQQTSWNKFWHGVAR